jgi:hypothetical protein
VKGSTPVIVVVPTKIKPDTVTTVIGGVNLVVNDTTSPRAANVLTAKSLLVTYYGKTITKAVLDQLGNPLDPLYSGAMIEEKIPAIGFYQTLNAAMNNNGVFFDPIGFIVPKMIPNSNAAIPPEAATAIPGSKEAKAWLSSKERVPYVPQKIPKQEGFLVRVGGHELEPIDRQLKISSVPGKPGQ